MSFYPQPPNVRCSLCKGPLGSAPPGCFWCEACRAPGEAAERERNERITATFRERAPPSTDKETQARTPPLRSAATPGLKDPRADRLLAVAIACAIFPGIPLAYGLHYLIFVFMEAGKPRILTSDDDLVISMFFGSFLPMIILVNTVFGNWIEAAAKGTPFERYPRATGIGGFFRGLLPAPLAFRIYGPNFCVHCSSTTCSCSFRRPRTVPTPSATPPQIPESPLGPVTPSGPSAAKAATQEAVSSHTPTGADKRSSRKILIASAVVVLALGGAVLGALGFSSGNSGSRMLAALPFIEKRFWISNYGEILGPYGRNELKQFVADGRLVPTAMVRSEHENEWRSVADVSEINVMFKYWVSYGIEIRGPYDLADLLRYVRNGQIAPHASILLDGTRRWTTIDNGGLPLRQ
jgi:hypothetical protein